MLHAGLFECGPCESAAVCYSTPGVCNQTRLACDYTPAVAETPCDGGRCCSRARLRASKRSGACASMLGQSFLILQLPLRPKVLWRAAKCFALSMAVIRSRPWDVGKNLPNPWRRCDGFGKCVFSEISPKVLESAPCDTTCPPGKKCVNGQVCCRAGGKAGVRRLFQREYGAGIKGCCSS